MNFETIFFFFIASLSITSAILMITNRNPVMGVLFLIINFFCLAILYLFLHAQFIAIIQILIYAGAIMVLFLFVIMLLNLGDEKGFIERTDLRKYVALGLACIVLIEILVGLGMPFMYNELRFHPEAGNMGTVENIGKSLFTEFLFPFEITSIVLLAAMVGVIVLAKKKLI